MENMATTEIKEIMRKFQLIDILEAFPSSEISFA